jgi:hypothetical protein
VVVVVPLDVVDVVDSVVVTAVAAEVVEVCTPFFSNLQRSLPMVYLCDIACLKLSAFFLHLSSDVQLLIWFFF